VIRQAKVQDAEAIKALIEFWAKKDSMLSRSLSEIYQNIGSFKVFEEQSKIIGCAYLSVIWKELAEIRSLAVKEEHANNGIGSKLVLALEEDALSLGIQKTFTLTTVPEFFKKIGYVVEDKAKMPPKIWADCINCTKFPNCDEEVLVKKL